MTDGVASAVCYLLFCWRWRRRRWWWWWYRSSSAHERSGAYLSEKKKKSSYFELALHGVYEIDYDNPNASYVLFFPFAFTHTHSLLSSLRATSCDYLHSHTTTLSTLPYLFLLPIFWIPGLLPNAVRTFPMPCHAMPCHNRGTLSLPILSYLRQSDSRAVFEAKYEKKKKKLGSKNSRISPREMIRGEFSLFR